MGKNKRKVVYYRSAGGVVLDAADRVLLLQRDVKRGDALVHEVRLPKGHIEKGETPQQAALREVCEESGYCDLQIIADLGEAHAAFDYKKKHVERDERYFLMRLASDEQQAPQPTSAHSEEALFSTMWADSLTAAEELLTYETEKAFASRARAWLEQKNKQ